ncbi:MAG: hypothetical protein E6G41_10470 [Actinobacteria bacterium]|nr:MAG: hypothetical protein E6G41_10470 [Actinomycetota bacterium]
MSDDADLAELARRALERPDAVSVMGDAVELVARVLRAGVGWGGGVAGTTGDVEAAAEAIRAAHEEARALVEELLGDITTEPLPGDLRRAKPA